MKKILAAAILVATPAILFAQPGSSTQLGNSMGSDASAQPRSHSGDMANGARMPTAKSSRKSSSMHRSSKSKHHASTSSSMATTPGN